VKVGAESFCEFGTDMYSYITP